MSNIIPFAQGAQLPAYLANRAALAQINSDITTASGFPVLSIKGKVFTLNKDGQKKILTRPDDPDEVLQNINLTVVRANKNARVFYAKAYSEDDAEGAKPACYSGDGVAPAADAREPQAKKCQLCPHAVWGSKAGDTGKGTACAVNTRLAVVDPDNVGEPWLLRVPAGSRANFADACKVADSRGLPYNAVVFKVGFDKEAPSPKLTFKPIGLVSDDAYDKIGKQYDSDDVKEIVGLLTRQSAAPALEAPAVEADELDAALAVKKVVAKAKEPAKPAVDVSDLEDIMPAKKPEPEAPKAKPAAKKKVEAEDAQEKPAKSGNDLAALIGDLDDLLGSTDD